MTRKEVEKALRELFPKAEKVLDRLILNSVTQEKVATIILDNPDMGVAITVDKNGNVFRYEVTQSGLHSIVKECKKASWELYFSNGGQLEKKSEKPDFELTPGVIMDAKVDAPDAYIQFDAGGQRCTYASVAEVANNLRTGFSFPAMDECITNVYVDSSKIPVDTFDELLGFLGLCGWISTETSYYDFAICVKPCACDGAIAMVLNFENQTKTFGRVEKLIKESDDPDYYNKLEESDVDVNYDYVGEIVTNEDKCTVFVKTDFSSEEAK